MPLTIADNGSKHGYNYGFYAQDEWEITDNLTLNYGLRYDAFSAFDAENQLSPRVNGVWKPTDTMTIHAGYARYFSPPPFELVASQDVGAVQQHHGGGNRPHRHHAAGRARRLFRRRRGTEDGRLDRRAGQLLQGVQEPDRRRPVRRAHHPDALQLCSWAGNMAAN